MLLNEISKSNLQSKREILDWIHNVSAKCSGLVIHNDLSVSARYFGVEQSVVPRLPFKVREVEESFYLVHCGLKSLENCPEKVGENFSVVGNKISTLEHIPAYIGGSLYVANNDLTSLKGCPEIIHGFHFNCSFNPLNSFDYFPKGFSYHKGGALANLTIPQNEYHYLCSGTNITSLRHVHKFIKNTPSFKFVEKQGAWIPYREEPAPEEKIPTNILGLMFIRDLKEVFLGNELLNQITEKHLAGDKDVHAFQEELLEIGFIEQAKF